MLDYEQLQALKARYAARAKLEKLIDFRGRLTSFAQLLKDREALFLTQPTIRTSADGFYDCLMANTAILVSKSKGWSQEVQLSFQRRWNDLNNREGGF
ncbi:MAG: hypothetical protein Q9208_005680 [Pyrenodesmia sp. 3 TL-2023]